MQVCTLARVSVVNVDPYYQFWFTPLAFYTSSNAPEQETSDGEEPFPPACCEHGAPRGGGGGGRKGERALLGAGPCGVHFEKLTGH